MIIPIRCFTCGKVLADKYNFYKRSVAQRKLANQNEAFQVDRLMYLTPENHKKTAEGMVLDELGLTKPSCRRHLLTHVDI